MQQDQRPPASASKKGHRAEEYGRTVGSEPRDLEGAAARGQDSLAAVLISRHNQRMNRMGAMHPDLTGRARKILNHLFTLDGGLRNLGVDQARAPIHGGGTWLGHLAWGVDSLVATIRLLACGQFVGAAQIARSQLERWALNLQHNAGITQRKGESLELYYDRLWACLDESGKLIPPLAPRNRTFRYLPAGERMVKPGNLYANLSELLHGRGKGADAILFEAVELLEQSDDRSEAFRIGHQILDAVELSVERISSCVARSFSEQGNRHAASAMADIRNFVPPAGHSPFTPVGLWPLMPATTLLPQAVEVLELGHQAMERVHGGIVPDEEKFRDDEMSELFFLSRRYRSAQVALQALEKEAELLGDEPLDYAELEARNFRQIITSETLGLVAWWTEDERISAAAAVVASGLRSAFWLWLEDDDRAMGVLRCALESLARLRAHLERPAKAEKLEVSPSTTPRDWLGAASWKRLSPLNMALGELAHTRAGSRWSGARNLLVALLPPDTDPEWAPNRGRGYALDIMVRLAAQVALRYVEPISLDLHAALRQLFSDNNIFDEDMTENFESWLNRTLQQKDFDFGGTDFIGPAYPQD